MITKEDNYRDEKKKKLKNNNERKDIAVAPLQDSPSVRGFQRQTRLLVPSGASCYVMGLVMAKHKLSHGIYSVIPTQTGGPVTVSAVPFSRLPPSSARQHFEPMERGNGR